MSSSEQGLAQGHKIRHRVVAIADELAMSVASVNFEVSKTHFVQHTRDQCLPLSVTWDGNMKSIR